MNVRDALLEEKKTHCDSLFYLLLGVELSRAGSAESHITATLYK